MEIDPQFRSEFERPRRAGEVLIQWRNKQVCQWEGTVDRRWHKYKFMALAQAEEFMVNCAPNSAFFEYRILSKLDKAGGS